MIAKIAVSSINFAVDKPYSYIVPENLTERIKIGLRVVVPFGKWNRRTEGLVLSIFRGESNDSFKLIDSILDVEPVLTDDQVKLALWMRNRFFCTVYEAAHVMLPSGMWFKNGEQRIKDKIVNTAKLNISSEEALVLAEQKKNKAPVQTAVLEFLMGVDTATVFDICAFTGASRSSINALVRLGAITVFQQEVLRRPVVDTIYKAGKIELNAEQTKAFNSLSKALCESKPSASLLFGITGSGKTAVYIKLIQLVLEKGKSALVLVPEIALTPQLMNTFSSYFGDDIALLHSSLAAGERCDEWKRIKSGRVHVVVGTRSAIFAPIENLGLIILDEEQEHTYKSENNPRYHARDIAKYRCVHENALLLLGSATPSLESMYNARAGKYTLLNIATRYNETDLPSVIIADMKSELKKGNGGNISNILRDEIQKNIDNGEQCILFINRRGANTLVACGECGYIFECPNCSVSETYHSFNNRLMCHYCGHSRTVPSVCPECGGTLKYVGSGTQKVESELMDIFQGVGIVRMDADTVAAAHSHEMLLNRFKTQKIPILLGTQMVTKGLDIENVTLVGVIEADKSLYMNDFRAHERTFSMLTQVIGRSGRGSKPGRAIIQTFTPDNEIIRLAASQDYNTFYNREIQLRNMIGAPPINDMFVLTATGTDEKMVINACCKARSSLDSYLEHEIGIQILGPTPAFITRINKHFRYRIIIFGRNSKQLRDTLSHVVREIISDREFRSVTAYVDYNPYD